jgi:hypothetical protein
MVWNKHKNVAEFINHKRKKNQPSGHLITTLKYTSFILKSGDEK